MERERERKLHYLISIFFRLFIIGIHLSTLDLSLYAYKSYSFYNDKNFCEEDINSHLSIATYCAKIFSIKRSPLSRIDPEAISCVINHDVVGCKE